MQIALANAVLQSLPFAEQCAYAAALGYDAIEVAPFTLDAEPHRLPPARRAEIRRIAADAGLAITGFNYLLYAPGGLSITADDAGVVAKTVAVADALLGLAADLGCRYVVHGSAPARRIASPEDAAGRARGLAFFRRIAPIAEAAGIDYLLEPLSRNLPPLYTDNFYINTVAEAAEIVSQVANPRLATMIDALAARNQERDSVPALIARWIPTGTVRHIHLNDRNLRAPGQGKDTFAEVLAALLRVGYAGVVTVEPFDYFPDPRGQAGFGIGYVRGLLDALNFGAAR